MSEKEKCLPSSGFHAHVTERLQGSVRNLDDVIQCPQCDNKATVENHDVMGGCDGCLFCNACGCEIDDDGGPHVCDLDAEGCKEAIYFCVNDSDGLIKMQKKRREIWNDKTRLRETGQSDS